ncbi:Cytochrome P450 [Naviculisporaceae sp. PSN 640]
MAHPSTMIRDTSLLPSLVGLCLLLILAINLKTRLARYLRLRHIPGPWAAGWTRLWLLRVAESGRSHLTFFEMNKKYGPLAKVGPYHLVTNDPDLMRHINTPRNGYSRGDWWKNSLRFHPETDNVCTVSTTAEHSVRRAKMAPGYTGRDLSKHGVEAAVDRTVMTLVNMIKERYIANNKPFDFGRKGQFFTLDVIADLAYGEPFGFLAKDEDRFNYLAITEKTFSMFLPITIYPWVWDIIASRAFKFLLPKEGDRTGFGRFIQIAKNKAAERYGPDRKVQGDMLGSFVAHGLTQNEAESEILLQIVAGSDTTSTAIRATLLAILTNPRVHATLLSEILSATSSLSEEEVTPNHTAQSMPYLQAVIREGMRWHPPVAGMLSKKVPEGGDNWKGMDLPAGVEIGYCAWGVMHDEKFWGEDAEEFRPERWLEADKDRLKAMEAQLGLTFGYGRWQCLGKDVAWMEMNKVFVELLRRFELSVVNTSKPWDSTCANIFLIKNFWIKAQPRHRALEN